MEGKTYVVATIRPWHVAAFHERIERLPGQWRLVTDHSRVDPEWKIDPVWRLRWDVYVSRALEQGIDIRYVFFPHWSWTIPPEIYENVECVGFHETPLPKGRGGSPVQNLIAMGEDHTVVTAFRVTGELDAGPVYMQRPLCLNGTAEEVFVRSARVVAGMIEEIVATEPEPRPQEGPLQEPWLRRVPGESELSGEAAIIGIDGGSPLASSKLAQLHRFIRMLDAEGYPRAYLDVGPFRLTFSRPALRVGRVVADVEFAVRGEKDVSAQ